MVFLLILTFYSCSHHDQENHGKALFNQTHIGKNNVVGCIACHSIHSTIHTTGPSLYGIANRAGLLIEGVSAQNYLKESIINPDAYIVSGYSPAVMFAHYRSELNDQEINDIVSYLLTLK